MLLSRWKIPNRSENLPNFGKIPLICTLYLAIARNAATDRYLLLFYCPFLRPTNPIYRLLKIQFEPCAKPTPRLRPPLSGAPLYKI